MISVDLLWNSVIDLVISRANDMKQVASEQRILSAGSMFRIGNLDQAFMIVTSIGQRSAFNFTYQFFPSNITYQDTTISNIGKDQNNSTTKA